MSLRYYQNDCFITCPKVTVFTHHFLDPCMRVKNLCTKCFSVYTIEGLPFNSQMRTFWLFKEKWWYSRHLWYVYCTFDMHVWSAWMFSCYCDWVWFFMWMFKMYEIDMYMCIALSVIRRAEFSYVLFNSILCVYLEM